MIPTRGMPHPDVAIVRDVLSQIKPGETIPRETVAKALGMQATDPAFLRRCATARKQLHRECVAKISPIPGGFIREDQDQILANVSGRGRRHVARSCRKNEQDLALIDVASLKPDKRAEFFAERTINNVVQVAVTAKTKTKMLGAAQATAAMLPMAKAIELLSNGGEQSK